MNMDVNTKSTSNYSFVRISAKMKEMAQSAHYASYTNRERKKIAVLLLRLDVLKNRPEYYRSGTELWDRAEVAAIEWALSRITPAEKEKVAA
jgi:hypothetical protein